MKNKLVATTNAEYKINKNEHEMQDFVNTKKLQMQTITNKLNK